MENNNKTEEWDASQTEAEFYSRIGQVEEFAYELTRDGVYGAADFAKSVAELAELADEAGDLKASHPDFNLWGIKVSAKTVKSEILKLVGSKI